MLINYIYVSNIIFKIFNFSFINFENVTINIIQHFACVCVYHTIFFGTWEKTLLIWIILSMFHENMLPIEVIFYTITLAKCQIIVKEN